MKKYFVFLAVLMAGAFSACAYDTTPFQLGIWPSKYQVVTEDINVSGLKINLPFGGNDYVQGVDLGIAATAKKISALQVNILVNRAHEEFTGLQFALVNQSGNSNGVTLGGLNVTEDKAKGIQVGVVNSSMSTRGLQIGLINYTESMTGLQIGIVNIITESVVPFFPIINFCF